jgi:hypothetical protein
VWGVHAISSPDIYSVMRNLQGMKFTNMLKELPSSIFSTLFLKLTFKND